MCLSVIEKPHRIDLGPLKLPSYKEKINVKRRHLAILSNALESTSLYIFVLAINIHLYPTIVREHTLRITFIDTQISFSLYLSFSHTHKYTHTHINQRARLKCLYIYSDSIVPRRKYVWRVAIGQRIIVLS